MAVPILVGQFLMGLSQLQRVDGSGKPVSAGLVSAAVMVSRSNAVLAQLGERHWRSAPGDAAEDGDKHRPPKSVNHRQRGQGNQQPGPPRVPDLTGD